MSLPNLVRWGAGAGLLGAALSLAEGLLILANPGYWRFDSPLDYLVAPVEGVALLAVLGGWRDCTPDRRGFTGVSVR